MSANEQIGRLQALLERVQARAGSPRGNGAAHAASFAHGASLEHAVAAAHAEPAVPYEPSASEPIESVAPATPMHAHAAYPSEAPEAYDDDADVEVSSEVVEVDIDVDEPEPMESGAQPVAQATMPPEDLLEDEPEGEPMAAQPSEHPEELEPIAQASPANEIEEPTPSSSRRPIAGEEPAAEAYEEESAPRHTPPPESGKQVAAAPSNHPPGRSAAEPASRMSSAPPPSLEGHTLIGGWREPGLGAAPSPNLAAGAPTGVRVPAPGRGTEPPATVVQAQASGTRLSPDVTRPELAADASVATFHGAPPVARPTTLGELLDLTLSL